MNLISRIEITLKKILVEDIYIPIDNEKSIVLNNTEARFCSKNEETLLGLIKKAKYLGVTYTKSSGNVRGKDYYFVLVERTNCNRDTIIFLAEEFIN